MLRFRTDSLEVTPYIENFYELVITSNITFPNEVILKALKEGIQDYMQENGIQTGVDYHISFTGSYQV